MCHLLKFPTVVLIEVLFFHFKSMQFYLLISLSFSISLPLSERARDRDTQRECVCVPTSMCILWKTGQNFECSYYHSPFQCLERLSLMKQEAHHFWPGWLASSSQDQYVSISGAQCWPSRHSQPCLTVQWVLGLKCLSDKCYYQISHLPNSSKPCRL